MRECPVFDVHRDAHAVFVGFVTHIPDALNALLMHEFRYFFDKSGFIHLKRNGGDNDLKIALFVFNYFRFPTRYNAAFAGRVCLVYVFFVVNDAAGGKVGTFYEFH